MIRVKYNSVLLIINNFKFIRLSGATIYLDEHFIIFTTIDLAKMVFEKICLTDKDLDIDAMLREDKETKRKSK